MSIPTKISKNQGGVKMKKTIIITIAMLCFFGIAIMIGANEVSANWQQSIEDEVNITASSPVENVENEFKEFGAYPFVKFSEHIQTLQDKSGMEALMSMEIETEEGMISYEEVAYIGGNALEKLFPDEVFTDKQFVIVPLNWISPHISERVVYEGFYIVENPADHPVHPRRNVLSYAYWIDAYTGEVLYVTKSEADTDVNLKRTPEQALEYAVALAKAMGYESYSKYNIEWARYNAEIEANTWGVELLVAEDKSLSFCFNDLEDNFLYAVNDTTSKYFQLVNEKGKPAQ